MEIPYSFLEKQVNKQFKDLAFFQMYFSRQCSLKRKGPYIERSLTKIENDLFHKQKLSGQKIKNVSFIKEIRMTLTAYQIIVNGTFKKQQEIRNDFMMTELDSLGEAIHKMFCQMISIIHFFSAIILKREKLALNNLMDTNLAEIRKKQQKAKKTQDQQAAKPTQEKEQKKLKEVQQLKYNFRELFNMQFTGDKENQLIQNLWKAILLENRNSIKECMKIKDSQLNNIIKDSCEYIYNNHTELDSIVRLAKQDIQLSEKTLNSFTDKNYLIEQNQQKINHMKSLGKDIVEYVRERVYEKAHAQTQTMLTMIDNSRPYITTKQLDEKRKMELKIKNFEKTFLEKQNYIQQIQQKLKETQEKLKIAQEKLYYGENQSSHDKDIENHLIATNLTHVRQRKKLSNFNSFKVSPTSKASVTTPKTQENSFTINKKFSKLAKTSSDLIPFFQKSSKRFSSTSKELATGNRYSNAKSVKNMMQHFDIGSVPNRNSDKRKFCKVRESHLVTEAKSFEQISKKSQKSQVDSAFKEDKVDADKEYDQNDHDLSIDDLKSCKDSASIIGSISQEAKKQHSTDQKGRKIKNSSGFTIIQTLKISIRPIHTKRQIDSAQKLKSEESQIVQPQQSRTVKSSNQKISNNRQKNNTRYFFQPLSDLERFGQNTHYREGSWLTVDRRKSPNTTMKIQHTDLKIEKENIRKQSQNLVSTASQFMPMNLIDLKNQKLKVSSLKQNSQILKDHKKQSHNLLKKSSTTKQTSSFVFLTQTQKKEEKACILKQD